MEKDVVKEIEALRKRALERQSLELLKKSHWGRIYAIAYLLIGVGSIFVYSLILNFAIVTSVMLGIVTWFIVSFVADTILIKTQRIDKQLDWLLNTSEGQKEMKISGMTEEQIRELKSEVEHEPLLKKYD
jgi:low affinity Fe/Cu permease